MSKATEESSESYRFTVQISDPSLPPEAVENIEAEVEKAATEALQSFGLLEKLKASELDQPEILREDFRTAGLAYNYM